MFAQVYGSSMVITGSNSIFASSFCSMRFYFSLQYRMINRRMTDFGIHPVAGYIIMMAAFTVFSLLLFDRIAFAGYVYILAGLSILPALGETRRNNFLKTCFTENAYYQVRIIENTVVIFPFVLFLIIKMMILQATVLFLTASLSALITYSAKTNYTIPTPFGKKPFEFTVGFRNTFIVILLAYFLLVMSAITGNFNLGIASLILLFLVFATFYLNPEDEFYVWIFKSKPVEFLMGKIKTASLYSTFLSLPLVITLGIIFPENAGNISGFLVLGYIYLATVILAKYSSFPRQISLPQFIVLVLTVWFPPLLLAVIPFFFAQSVKRLNVILG
jgi:hypothetical protein